MSKEKGETSTSVHCEFSSHHRLFQDLVYECMNCLVSAMRPRYRLPAKIVLPTIREGYEELVHDRNQVNVGSHDPPIAPLTLGDPRTQIPIGIPRQTVPGCPGNDSTQQQVESPPPTNTQVIQGQYKKLVPRTTLSCVTEADVETQHQREMEDNIDPGSLDPGLGRIVAKPGPLVSDPLEAPYSRTDSFLTAARLARRGCSAPPPSLSKPEVPRHPSRPEICSKGPSASHSPVQNSPPAQQSPSSIGAFTYRLLLQGHADSTPGGGRRNCKQLMTKETGGGRKTTRGRETGCDRQTEEEKPRIEGRQTCVLSVNRQEARERQAGVVSIWASGCRSTWRQSRRLRAPMLPAIAEI